MGESNSRFCSIANDLAAAANYEGRHPTGTVRESRSLAEIHDEIIGKICARGETEIFNPTGRTMMTGYRARPFVYVKGRKYPSRDFICGHALYDKNNTIEIWYDFFCYAYTGFKIEELGLCDPAVWYDNLDLISKMEKTKGEF